MQFQSLYRSTFFFFVAVSQLVAAAPMRQLEVPGAVAPKLDVTSTRRDINVLNNSGNNNGSNNGNSGNNNGNNSGNNGNNSGNNKSETTTNTLFNDEVFDTSDNAVQKETHEQNTSTNQPPDR